MKKTPKIEVCSYCSGFDVNELKNKIKAKISCIGKCSKKNPELNGKVYGFLNGEYTVCDTKESCSADGKCSGWPTASVQLRGRNY